LKALIVADGDVPSRSIVDRLLGGDRDEDRLVIAADGGALKAEAIGMHPDVVVGDGDSLTPAAIGRLRREGVTVKLHPADKDESDTELAVREALDRGADGFVVIGAFGGLRIEHTVANLLLLCLPELAGRAVLADGASTVRLMGVAGEDQTEVRGAPGDFVSLLPLSEQVSGVTTSGLRYELTDESLIQGPARGLSNVLLRPTATVSTQSGRLLVIHTRRSEV
jgi:thiamine pyrophosphokinase